MYPILFKIGPITMHAYGFFVALGFVIGITLAIHFGKQEGIPRETILDIGFYALLAAIIGSRLFYVLVEYKYFLKHPLDIFKIWEGGLVFFGALLGALLVLIFYLKKKSLPFWKTFDTLTPSVALGHAIGRIGCFCAGCCHGSQTDIAWGVTFKHPASMAILGVPLHPTQLYESAAELSIFIFLLFWRKHKKFDGQVFWTYVFLYSTVRFIIEFFRGDKGRGFIYGDFSVAQGISVLLLVTSVIFMAVSYRKKA